MVFDVSDAYQNFWDRFTKPEHQFANITVPEDWNDKISHVTSFFSLEHADHPVAFIQDVHRLLEDNGQFLIIVPDFSNNWADMIVADHVNHFTSESIRYLLERNGFIVTDIDREIYHGTFVVTARKADQVEHNKECANDVGDVIDETKKIASFWKNFSGRIAAIEKEIGSGRFVIYGSGFYGAFISTLMNAAPQCYLDQSPHRQGRMFFSKEIISPENMPQGVEHMIVGLNPGIAQQAIESNQNLDLDNIQVHYID